MPSRSLITADVREELDILAGSCGVSVGDREGPLAPEPHRRALALLDRLHSRTAALARQRHRATLLALHALIRRDHEGAQKLVDAAEEANTRLTQEWWGFFDQLDGTAASLWKTEG